MLTQRTAVVSGRAAARFAPALPSRPALRSVVRRFKEEDNLHEAIEEAASHKQGKVTDTKLSPEQLEEVYRAPAGKISPRMAEMRADLGSAASDPAVAEYAGPLQTLQAFDGPIPETFNGRLCMLAVPIALLEEWAHANTMAQQEWADANTMAQQVQAHPERVIGISLLILIATCVPVFKGYTRKEPFANSIWSPMAENWNGRLAMLGFAGMVATEMITGVNVLQAWGLQPLATLASTVNPVTGL
ncbi:hypothetical protein OEZ85_000507 [Tetradesmus obliquus]|uniref:Uncharacterized protein n=1 Tax=Tetradesmus obliquus TaxID=3088 RepID=A0ABY8UJQ8_TETOB|nr:hypothetical protein OEZ85_000507 [Tetradesmus obliquus]